MYIYIYICFVIVFEPYTNVNAIRAKTIDRVRDVFSTISFVLTVSSRARPFTPYTQPRVSRTRPYICEDIPAHRSDPVRTRYEHTRCEILNRFTETQLRVYNLTQSRSHAILRPPRTIKQRARTGDGCELLSFAE